MNVLAIKTKNGNYYCQYGDYYFVVNNKANRLLKLTNQAEWEWIRSKNVLLEAKDVQEVKEVIELASLTEKSGYFIQKIKRMTFDEMRNTQNYQESFDYVNNDCNYVVACYSDSSVHKVEPYKGGASTSQAGNHGHPIQWDGESYFETLQEFITKSGQYPSLIIECRSQHYDRQGDGANYVYNAIVIPPREEYDKYTGVVEETTTTLRTMTLII